MTMLTSSTERRLLANFNFPLLGTVLLVCVLGLFNLASASKTAHDEVWVSQAWWLSLGLAVAIVMCTFDYRHLLQMAYPAWVLALILLLAVLLFGDFHKGAQRWLALGPIRFQPSEFAKIAVILALARFYHEDKEPPDGYTLGRMWRPALLLLLPVLLVMKQPDLGTSLIILAIGGSVMLFARVEKKTLFSLVGIGAGVATVAWFFLLKPYQRVRVTAFLNPGADTLGSGYHANQSIIAVGSGGLTGKGWGEGTQTQLRFLPEQHTDFVFSVWAEEHGLMGGLIVVALYGVFLLLAVAVASSSKDRFGVFISIGVASLVFFQVIVNIGMVIGLLPVVGVTLPFLSYGGSSVVTSMAAVGLLLNISMRRFLF